MPVWIGGCSRPALRRAARWDGWIMAAIDEQAKVWFGPDRLAEAVVYLGEHGAGSRLGSRAEPSGRIVEYCTSRRVNTPRGIQSGAYRPTTRGVTCPPSP